MSSCTVKIDNILVKYLIHMRVSNADSSHALSNKHTMLNTVLVLDMWSCPRQWYHIIKPKI